MAWSVRPRCGLTQSGAYLSSNSVFRKDGPEGRLLERTSVRPEPNSSRCTHIIFRRPSSGCGDCDTRSDYLVSTDADASKHLERNIDTELAKQLCKRLERLRKKPITARGILPEPIRDKAGLHAVLSPRFLRREARKVFEELCVGANVRVLIDEPAARGKPQLRLLATGDADRQARRQTWTMRVERYALAEDATVRVEVATEGGLGRWLGGQQTLEGKGGTAS
jgi:hypothetical protein